MPKKINHQNIIKLYKQGIKQAAIAKMLEISRRTVCSIVKEYREGNPFRRSVQISKDEPQETPSNQGFSEDKNVSPTNTINLQKRANKLLKMHQIYKGKLIETQIPEDIVNVVTSEELLEQEGNRIVVKRGPNEVTSYAFIRPDGCMMDCANCLIDKCELFNTVFGKTEERTKDMAA